MKNILLIIPPANLGYGYINTFFWQKGMLHIATYLECESKGEYSVSICDGNNRNMSECMNALNEKDYYAAGVYCLDHTRINGSMLINEVISKKIPKLFLGGPGIINSKESYRKVWGDRVGNTSILYCEGQGEKAIFGFLGSEKSPSKDGKDWDLSIYEANEKDLHYVSYKKDLKSYVEKQLSDPSYPYPAITHSTLSHLGCAYRLKTGGCSFCGIPHHFCYYVDGDIFWRDFRNFREFCHKELGYSPDQVRSIKDWGDSINSDILEELLEKRPEDCSKVWYNCYLSCRDITVHNLEILKKLNCFSVYIGVDGTAIKSLEDLNKGYSQKALIKKLELLNAYPFKVEIGLILGSGGETVESLEQIVSFAKRLADMFREKVIVIQGNVLIPMPGSLLYKKLDEEIGQKEKVNHPLESFIVQKRIEAWLKFKTEISFQDCVNTQHKIEAISPRKHSYVELKKD